MAIVFAVKKWCDYLLGHKIVIRTDQRSLKFLLEQREVSVEHQKWLTKLLGYGFDIQYKPGLENKVVDALSRLESTVELMALTIPHLLQLDEVATQVLADPKLGSIVAELRQDPVAWSGYTLVHGHLLYKQHLVLPRGSPLVAAMIREFHNGLVGRNEVRHTDVVACSTC